jgi:hypothetical protein
MKNSALSPYYKIWVDAIELTKSSKAEGKNWKLFTIIPISVLQGINLLTILLWIRALSNRKFMVLIPVSVFNAIPFNTFISVVLTFFLPFLILNYLLIFNNNRYQMLMKIYNPRNGKRYFWYIALSLGIFVIPYLLKLIF